MFSEACSLFVVSLRSFLHSFPLFSAACSLFSQNTGVGVPLRSLRLPVRQAGLSVIILLSFFCLFVFRLSFRFLLRRGKMEPLNLGTKP